MDKRTTKRERFSRHRKGVRQPLPVRTVPGDADTAYSPDPAARPASDPICRLLDLAETRRGSATVTAPHVGNGFVQSAADVKPLDEKDLRTGLTLLESLPHPVFWIGEARDIAWSNPAARDCYTPWTGRCHAVFHGHTLPCEAYGEPCPLRAAAAINTAISVAHVHQTRGGRPPLEITAIPVVGGGGILLHIPIGELFTIDALTGTQTRAHFEQAARRDLALMKRIRTPYALVMLDLDHFKQLNDRHGHPAGDLMLTAIGSAINDNIRTTDTAGRWGGEEFGVFLPGVDAAGALQQVRRLQEAIRGITVAYGEALLRISASFGVYSSHLDYDFNRAVRGADAALYRAKRLGRNRIEVGGGG